jgi:hypothetical protein
MYPEFEALTAVVMKRSVCWDITTCGALNVARRFEGTRRLHFQGRRISQAINQRENRWQVEAGNGLHGVISQKRELLIKCIVDQGSEQQMLNNPVIQNRKLIT